MLYLFAEARNKVRNKSPYSTQGGHEMGKLSDNLSKKLSSSKDLIAIQSKGRQIPSDM